MEIITPELLKKKIEIIKKSLANSGHGSDTKNDTIVGPENNNTLVPTIVQGKTENGTVVEAEKDKILGSTIVPGNIGNSTIVVSNGVQGNSGQKVDLGVTKTNDELENIKIILSIIAKLSKPQQGTGTGTSIGQQTEPIDSNRKCIDIPKMPNFSNLIPEEEPTVNEYVRSDTSIKCNDIQENENGIQKTINPIAFIESNITDKCIYNNASSKQ